jgi:hypothetical protein
MDTRPNKTRFILPIAIVIIVICIGFNLSKPPKMAWSSYHEKVYGFDIKYPSSWVIQDNMTDKGCCLFVVNVNVATTTSNNASGTPTVTITASEPIRIQIGHYYRVSLFDPFKMATNTPITLGKNPAVTGVNGNVPYYLIPMTEVDGIGASYFTSTGKIDDPLTRKTVEDVLSTISFTGTSTATSTARWIRK